MGTATSQPFRMWLRSQLDRKKAANESYGVRTLARGMAEQHPEGATFRTVETYRRTLNKYLAGSTVPTKAMRTAICDALGVPREELPADDDPEDPLARLMRIRREEERILRDLNPAHRARALDRQVAS